MKKLFLNRLTPMLSGLGMLLTINLYGGENAVSFALLSDVHVSPGSSYADNLRKIVEEINADSTIEWVQVNGDLTDFGTDAEIKLVKEILDGLNVPYQAVSGNHDTAWMPDAGLAFMKHFGDDRFLERLGDLLLVGLSTGPFVENGPGYFRTEDLRWLAESLQENYKPGDRILFFSHYRLVEVPLQTGNSGKVVEILNQYPSVIAIHGHEHEWEVRNCKGIPSVILRSVILVNPPEGDGPGYAIGKIDDQTMDIYNKVLGKNATESPLYSFPFTAEEADPGTVKSEQYPSAHSSRNELSPQNAPVNEILDVKTTLFAAPAAAGNQLFVADGGGILRGYREKNGKFEISFEKKYPYMLASNLMVDGDVVIVAGSDDTLRALSASTGNVIWEQPIAASGCRGTIQDGDLYIGDSAGNFYKIAVEDGKILWAFNGAGATFQAAPTLDGNEVFVGNWDQFFYCLNKETGALKWKWGHHDIGRYGAPGNCSAAATADTVYVATPEAILWALDRTTGVPRWQNASREIRYSLSLSPDKTTLYAKGPGEIVAIDATAPDYREKWITRNDLGGDPSPCAPQEIDGIVYWTGWNGIVCAANAADGTMLWRKRCGNSQATGFFRAPDDTLYFGLREGKIMKWDPSEQK